jgi:hypothetical protein
MNERRKSPRGTFVRFKLFALKISASKSHKADVVRVTKKISSQLRQGKWRQALLSLERIDEDDEVQKNCFHLFFPTCQVRVSRSLLLFSSSSSTASSRD